MTKKDHESFGLVSFHRISNGGTRLFESSVKSPTSIQLTIKRAVVDRDLHSNWIFGRDTLVEVELSPAQFASLLTTMNVGEGVPCTIRYARDGELKRMERVPDQELDTQKIKDEYRQELEQYFEKELSPQVEGIREILDSTDRLKRADRDQISSLLDILEGKFSHSASFTLDQFEESTEKVVTQAKAEIDSFVTTMVQKTGLETLKAENVLLPKGREDEEGI